MHEHGQATCIRRDVFDPAFAGELDQRNGLQARFGVFAEEGRVGLGAFAAARTPHALHERRDRAGRVGLEDQVEVAYVDAQLEGRGAHDAGVGPAGEALFGGSSLFQRDRAVVHEHVDRAATHAVPAFKAASYAASTSSRSSTTRPRSNPVSPRLAQAKPDARADLESRPQLGRSRDAPRRRV